MKRWRQLSKTLAGWFLPGQDSARQGQVRRRGPVTHVIILDGTMSSLMEGSESNAGLTYRLLQEVGAQVSVYYESGVQWRDWRSTPEVLMGRGINRQIRRAYGYLASRFRPGDKIYLLGYSRGAYAVRSLAGVIDMVGLLRSECATERNIRQVYRHYEGGPATHTAKEFSAEHCHENTEIEMLGVWDTVKALGIRLPFVWRWSERNHAFHSHALGSSTKRGFHALAMDETRTVFQPVMWATPPDESTSETVVQMWFRGAHGDVGGQLGGFLAARPLANIPLVWMLERAQGCGLPLPDGWRGRFECDATAPSVGTWRNWGKLFLSRRRRRVGMDKSERIHKSALPAGQRDAALSAQE